MNDIPLLLPDWPIADKVFACTTLRSGGVSRGGFHSLNLAAHVGDDPQAVSQNRERLRQSLHLPEPTRWLNQCHGNLAIDYEQLGGAPVDADAVYSRHAGQVCAVLTADCLPVLLAEQEGNAVAAIHAGWRGLLGGVIETTVAALAWPGERLLAWLGPAIGPRRFEVGSEVRQQFIAAHAAAEVCFINGANGRFLADLYGLARMRLGLLGIQRIYGGNRCTMDEAARFFSFRREPRCGRMASLIYLRPT